MMYETQEIIGSLMLVAMFAGMFAVFWKLTSLKDTLVIFTFAGIVFLWIAIAVELIY